MFDPKTINQKEQQWGISCVGSVPGAAERKKTRQPPFPQRFIVLYYVLWGRKSASPFSFLLDSSSPVALLRLAADVSWIAVDVVAPVFLTLVPDSRKGCGQSETAVHLCF